MDLLVTESAIRERMNLPESADLSDSVLSALAAAQIRIESALGVKFERREAMVDVFRVDVKHFWPTLPNDLAALRLRTGFVDRESLVVKSFRSLEYAMDPAIAGDVVESRYYRMSADDAVKGILRIDARRYDLHCIEVTYDAGFENADDEDIPAWLPEVILTRATAVLNTVSPNDATAEALSLLVEQQAQISQIIAPHVRGNVPFSFRPIM